MNSLLFRLCLIAGVIFFAGCKEVYYPEIDAIPNTIAVEGLITDQPGPYRIRLSYSSNFYNVDLSGRVENARVVVFDDKGGFFEFSEVNPGVYQSPEHMIGMVGYTYTLEFETSDGELYRSFPQTLMAPYEIEQLNATEAIRTLTSVSVSGGLVVSEIEGVEGALVVTAAAENPANVRFKADAKVLYTTESGWDRFYCWKEVYRFEGPDNINLPVTGNQPGDVSNNAVAFLPSNPEYYFMQSGELISKILVRVSLFSINDDVYNFYLDVNKQLKSDGSLFAPIPSQISGNIICVSDSEKTVVGLFEASSLRTGGYILNLPTVNNQLNFEATGLYEQIPGPGCMQNEIPPFWVN
jgi:hypothetical protein